MTAAAPPTEQVAVLYGLRHRRWWVGAMAFGGCLKQVFVADEAWVYSAP